MIRRHALSACMSFALLGWGCATPEETATMASVDALLGEDVDPNNLLTDAQLEGDQQITVANVQAVLEHYDSGLADYTEGGRSAAAWIVQESLQDRISPIYMLARLETESSIVRGGTREHLEKATGCGCPDGNRCDPQLSGFGSQIDCAARLIRGYLRDLDSTGSTVVGYAVGEPLKTSDPCWVTPANRATVALYTYTPWVGAYGSTCGTSQWGGSSLVAVLYAIFEADLAELGVRSGDVPSASSAGPECGLGDGDYCGGNGVAGDPNVLYHCSAGVARPKTRCGVGCRAMLDGQNDSCLVGCP